MCRVSLFTSRIYEEILGIEIREIAELPNHMVRLGFQGILLHCALRFT